ncbi:MAG: fused MFS/spermidine synthase [Chthoniobacterales bacterium]
MSRSTRGFLFLAFFLSGYCGLTYQVIWTRLAFASFGIIAPVLSIVISVFMLGLSVGSWVGGKWVDTVVKRTGYSALLFYALAELIIAIGGYSVPKLFKLGEAFLLSGGETDSFRYLFLSALVLAVSILPWCFFMGTTFPFMMAYVREQDRRTSDSFSYLYLANVLGAMTGCLLTAVVFVEILGFKHTLWTAAAINLIIAALSAFIAWKRPQPAFEGARREAKRLPKSAKRPAKSPARRRVIKSVLFWTGFSAMAMEVMWARAFTPVLTTQVYSFALIVFAYLGATFLGSALYRRALARRAVRSMAALISMLSIAAFLPILCNDQRFLSNTPDLAGYISAAVLLLSICPLCALLGYLTPSLIDEYSAGEPARAGRAYALNVAGCILGPLFASYILLPLFGERHGIIILGLPFLAFAFFGSRSLPSSYRWGLQLSGIACLVWSLFYSVDLAAFSLRRSAKTEIRRDYAASVISTGEGFAKRLLVNGVGVTSLLPITKFMAHVPLAVHNGKPESVLVICFGMGTTYRSVLSWEVKTVVVELVPSVRDAFPFYHADAARVLSKPEGRIVIDDGRRYLNRTQDTFDVIVIDPPPPVEAAGSSLLYSEEFYEVAKRHLRPNGILQAWFPGGNDQTGRAVLRSLRDAFPYHRCFGSPFDPGILILASADPIAGVTLDQAATNMPNNAVDDLLEWSDSRDVQGYLAQMQQREFSIDEALDPDPRTRVTDDHPYNEYFLLRRWGIF